VSRGDPNGALELLRQYDRRFPTGRLQAERAAAGVLALCGAGRSTEAKAAAERFQRRWPRSPLAPRVASTCARGSK
jgi:outer membrane protein assembly factor BamD (BamD/ComL family)